MEVHVENQVNITFNSEVAIFITYKGFGQKLGDHPNSPLNFGQHLEYQVHNCSVKRVRQNSIGLMVVELL